MPVLEFVEPVPEELPVVELPVGVELLPVLLLVELLPLALLVVVLLVFVPPPPHAVSNKRRATTSHKRCAIQAEMPSSSAGLPCLGRSACFRLPDRLGPHSPFGRCAALAIVADCF